MPRPGEPGSETWGKADISKFIVSTWGTAGSYDPVRDAIYWGVANPSPYTRLERYGKHDAVPTTSPSELYSNSTVALDPETGKLKWYYQHLPGDDWDQDYSQERVLARTRFNPDPKNVKWFNPDIKRGESRDVIVNVGEGGGLWVLDRDNGQFLWGIPFPYDAPNFLISDIDGKTGKVQLNEELIAKFPGDRNVLCAYNTDSYWADAYSPLTNSLYAPFADSCLDMTAAGPDGPQRRFGVQREGGDPEKFSGLAKVNLETGEMIRFGEGRSPTNGSVLATATNLIFHGTLDRKFRAYDAEDGKVLWQTTLGGPVQTSTITYEIEGKQYILVMTGESSLTPNLAKQAGIPFVKDHHAFYVFALPD
jgi:alcohol dehydrogenase (cytochrome c)